MNNVSPLTLQRSRLIQDLERGLCSQARHPARQLELMLDGLYHDSKTPYSGKPHIIRRTMYGNSLEGAEAAVLIERIVARLTRDRDLDQMVSMLLEAMKGVGSAVVIIIGVALWVVPDPIAKALKLGVSGEEI